MLESGRVCCYHCAGRKDILNGWMLICSFHHIKYDVWMVALLLVPK